MTASVRPQLDNWIDGSAVPARLGGRFDVLDPMDDSVHRVATRSTAEDVDAAVGAAKAAFERNRFVPLKEREAVLQRAAGLLEARQAEILDILIDEIGSPVQKARFEFGKGLAMMRAAAGMCRQVKGATLPSDTPGRLSMSVRHPLGVVAAITPFNVPLIKGVRLTANALAVGNAVVLLPSELAPSIGVLLGEVYRDAGLADGLFNVVLGFGEEIGDALTTHKDVAMVTFTGSCRVGQHIARLCAERNRRVTLELGGKSPLIVGADADLDQAVAGALHGIFTYQGQVCMGASRIYVERPVSDVFLDRFAKAAAALGTGDLRDPKTVIGPIISERQRERIRGHIADAVAKGARVVTGNDWDGHRCRPTILTGVTHEMAVKDEETFGPVTSVYVVDSFEDAIVAANASRFGLSAGVYTRDVGRALDAAERLRAGMVHVNSSPLQDEPHVPFGGVGESGVGREGTEADIEAMTEWKWITIQR